jgi:predicted HTH transcriptional regulator
MADDTLDLSSLINRGRELRNLEHKRSVDWGDPAIKAKITKSILGMSNLKDGGYITIGVVQQGHDFVPVGMTDEHFASWEQDALAKHVANYSDPPTEVYLHKYEENGMKFVIIQVPEFRDLPTICKKDGEEKLYKGNIYTRSRSKNETRTVESQTEMREVLDMAIEKGIRELLARTRRIGIALTDKSKSDEELFDEQLGDI